MIVKPVIHELSFRAMATPARSWLTAVQNRLCPWGKGCFRLYIWKWCFYPILTISYSLVDSRDYRILWRWQLSAVKLCVYKLLYCLVSYTLPQSDGIVILCELVSYAQVASYAGGYVRQWIISVIHSRLSYWSLECIITDSVLVVLQSAKCVALIIWSVHK